MLERLYQTAPPLARLIKESEIQFKWLLIWLFFLAINRGTQRRSRPFDPGKVKRVLFLRHDKIGDMVVTLETFHTLKAYFPKIEIGVMASPGNAAIVRDDDTVSFTHVYGKKAKDIYRLYKEVSKMHYDVVIDLLTGPSVTSMIIAMATCPGAYRIGAGKVGVSKYYDYYSFETVNRAKGLHVSEIFRSMLMPFGIPLTRGVLDREIQLSPKIRERASEVFAGIRDRQYPHIIFLNGMAGRLGRTLGVKKFTQLVEFLSENYPDIQFIISYPPDSIGFALKAKENAGPNFSLLPKGLSILDVIALLRHFDMVISVDTSICHIASKINVPLVAMYTGNPTNYMRWRPTGKRLWVARSPHHELLEHIHMEDVYKAVIEGISEQFGVQPRKSLV